MDFLGALSKFGSFGSGISGAISPFANAFSSGLGLFNGIKSLFSDSGKKALNLQKDLYKYQFDLQKQMFDYQNDVSLQNWNLQNEYNSPVQQMQRYADAGLNTNLIYGGNGQIAGNAESMSSSSTGSGVSSSDMKTLVGLTQRQIDLDNFAQMRQNAVADSQVNLNNANAELARANAGEVHDNAISYRDLNSSQRATLEIQSRQSEKYISQMDERFSVEMAYMRSQIHLYGEQAKLFDSQVQTALYNLIEIFPLEKQKLVKEITEMMPAMLEEIMSRTKCSYAQAAAAYANASYTYSLKAGQDIQNSYNNNVLGSATYRQAVVDSAVAGVHSLRYNNAYTSARSFNERVGIPYVFTLTQKGGWSGFGFGTNGSDDRPVVPHFENGKLVYKPLYKH